MRRGEEEEAGVTLITRMRDQGLYRPTILTQGRYQAALGTPPFAFGITNRVDELLNLLFDSRWNEPEARPIARWLKRALRRLLGN
jgi:hypothetical protein